MKPTTFEYFAPKNVEEALSLLGEYGDEARILAGGQSLVPLLNLRLARVKCLIDINRIPELSFTRESDNHLRIGCLTRHSNIAGSELVRTKCGILGRAASLIGHVAIRNRGTLGGSLCHADPVAELPLAIMVLGGEITILSSHNSRILRSNEFFLDYYTTSVDTRELVTEIKVPVLLGNTGWGFRELSRRTGDFAVVAAAAIVRLDEAGKCETINIAIAGGGSTPMRIEQAEATLVGKRPDDKGLTEVARLVAENSSPVSDMVASERYRRQMIKVMTKKALRDAVMMLEGI